MKAFFIASCLFLTGCMTTTQSISEHNINTLTSTSNYSEYEMHFLNPNILSSFFNEDLTTAYYRSSENTIITIDTTWLSSTDIAFVISGENVQTIFYFHIVPNTIYYLTSESYNGTMHSLATVQKFELEHVFYSTTMETNNLVQPLWYYENNGTNVTIFNNLISFQIKEKFGITAFTINEVLYEYVEQIYK